MVHANQYKTVRILPRLPESGAILRRSRLDDNLRIPALDLPMNLHLR